MAGRARENTGVTNSSGRTNNTGAGSDTWVGLLSQCIDSIGVADFPRQLVAALQSLTDFDYSVVFAYYQNEKPICLYHNFPSQKRTIFVDDYLKGPYLLDPFFKVCDRKVEPGLYRIRDIAPDRFYQSEYYRSYYMQTKLAEEIGYTLHLQSGVAIVFSLMRSGQHARFSARQFKTLASVGPVVVSLARRHWTDIHESFAIDTTAARGEDDHANVENTVSALFSKRITPRETQVVAHVLEGHSSDSIARNLGISVGTVRIHRRNIYAKLQISSQQELFAIFFKSITMGRG